MIFILNHIAKDGMFRHSFLLFFKHLSSCVIVKKSGFAVFAWGHTAYSVFCDDPISRANQRGVFIEMKTFINTVLLVANIISWVVVVLFGAIGIYEQITGPAGVEKLLKKLNIPLSFNQVFIIGIISIVLLWVTYILRKKLSGTV